MLHTKYQCSRPYGFRQELFFSCFPYISLCKICDPQGSAMVGPRGGGHYLNKLGKSDATYQISKL